MEKNYTTKSVIFTNLKNMKDFEDYLKSSKNQNLKIFANKKQTHFIEYFGDNDLALLDISRAGFPVHYIYFYRDKYLIHIKELSEKEKLIYNGIADSCNRLKGYAKEAIKIKKDMNNKINNLYIKYEKREEENQKYLLNMLNNF